MGCGEEDASARVRVWVWGRRRRGGEEGGEGVLRVEKTTGRVAISFDGSPRSFRGLFEKGGHRVRRRLDGGWCQATLFSLASDHVSAVIRLGP